ncbi:MAG: hypothetical protein ACK4HQ_04755 [Brevinematales bacterium]
MRSFGMGIMMILRGVAIYYPEQGNVFVKAVCLPCSMASLF